MINKTAILLFARTARQESIHKRMFSNKAAKNKVVFELLLHHTKQVCRNSGLPLIEIDETGQRGSTFGEKITNAFSDAFAMGFENIICVGSDTPGISLAHLKRANKYLDDDNACIGNDNHGGAWLIAISANHFVNGILNNIDWNTSKVFAQLMENGCALNKCVCILSEEINLNNKKDLKLLLYSSTDFELVIVLRSILRHISVAVIQITNFIKNIFRQSYILRGPPAFLVKIA